ncbi:hypothetical protein BJF78_24780 [Pseudonocardia sp. CNS-139]|nr:hypothetical protein BJF78_24780 [Pseudonocardia sp. CNS-139]
MTTPGRGQSRAGNGRFVREVDTAERDAEACRLRSSGYTYAQIAAQIGYTDASNARRAVQRALAEVVQEPAQELIQLELDRLDALARQAHAVLDREHLVASAGRLVLGPDGLPLRDDMPVLAAVDRLLRIQERRARLLGLDAPVKAAARVTHATADIDAAVAELAQLIDEMDSTERTALIQKQTKGLP